MRAKSGKNFRRDLAIGHKGEDIVRSILEADGVEVKTIGYGRQVCGDLRGDGIDLEVKYDLLEARSGFIAVEFFNPKAARPSGIAVSKSTGWIFVLADGSAWLCRTSALRKHVGKGHEGEGFVRYVTNSGDGNSSVILYDRQLLFACLFRRLDGRPAGTIKPLIHKLREQQVDIMRDTDKLNSPASPLENM